MSINFILILTINVVISTLVVNFKEQVSKANGKTILQLCWNTTKRWYWISFYAHVKYYLKNPIIFVIFPKTKRALRQKWLFSCFHFLL
jgi:hypothetical protein